MVKNPRLEARRRAISDRRRVRVGGFWLLPETGFLADFVRSGAYGERVPQPPRPGQGAGVKPGPFSPWDLSPVPGKKSAWEVKNGRFD